MLGAAGILYLVFIVVFIWPAAEDSGEEMDQQV